MEENKDYINKSVKNINATLSLIFILIILIIGAIILLLNYRSNNKSINNGSNNSEKVRSNEYYVYNYNSSSAFIYLLKDYKFFMQYNPSEGSPYGYIGTYKIVDNYLKLDVKYSFGSGCGITEESTKLEMKITNDNITYTNKNNVNEEFIKSSDNGERYYLNAGLCTEDESEAKKVYDLGFNIHYEKCDDDGNNCHGKMYNGFGKSIINDNKKATDDDESKNTLSTQDNNVSDKIDYITSIDLVTNVTNYGNNDFDTNKTYNIKGHAVKYKIYDETYIQDLDVSVRNVDAIIDNTFTLKQVVSTSLGSNAWNELYISDKYIVVLDGWEASLDATLTIYDKNGKVLKKLFDNKWVCGNKIENDNIYIKYVEKYYNSKGYDYTILKINILDSKYSVEKVETKTIPDVDYTECIF